MLDAEVSSHEYGCQLSGEFLERIVLGAALIDLRAIEAGLVTRPMAQLMQCSTVVPAQLVGVSVTEKILGRWQNDMVCDGLVISLWTTGLDPNVSATVADELLDIIQPLHLGAFLTLRDLSLKADLLCVPESHCPEEQPGLLIAVFIQHRLTLGVLQLGRHRRQDIGGSLLTLGDRRVGRLPALVC